MRLCYDQLRLLRFNVGQLLFALAVCWNMGSWALAQGDAYPLHYPRAKPSGLSSGASPQSRQQQRAEVNPGVREAASSPSHASLVSGSQAAGSQGRALDLPAPYQAPRYVMPQRGAEVDTESTVETTAQRRVATAGNRGSATTSLEVTTSSISPANQAAPSSLTAKPAANSAAKPAGKAGIPLARPDSSKSKDAKKATNPASTSQALTTVISSLGIVLAVFLVLTWVAKKFSPPGMGVVPKEAVELLGRSPLSGRQQMQVVRIGNKLLLVALTVGGAETLTEITDPEEVERLTALCRKTQANSSTASFQQLVTQLESSTTNRGFVDSGDDRLGGRSVAGSNLRSNRSGRA